MLFCIVSLFLTPAHVVHGLHSKICMIPGMLLDDISPVREEVGYILVSKCIINYLPMTQMLKKFMVYKIFTYLAINVSYDQIPKSKNTHILTNFSI